MIRRFTAGLINTILQRLDNTSGPTGQCAFLGSQLQALAQQPPVSHTTAQNDLYQAWDIAFNLDIVGETNPYTGSQLWPYLPLEEANRWLSALPGGKPIAKAGFSSQLGQCLDVLDAANHPAAQDLLERTLRHVEVKRQDCLSTPLGEPPANVWMERHDVTIAFCRASQRHNDLRFLNAALKMTDWYQPRYRSNTSHLNEKARYLLALASQESCAREFGL